MRRILFSVILIGCIYPSAARLEPGPVGQWLMDTPASMFSVGMDRLDKKVAIIAEQIGPKVIKTENSENTKLLASGGALYNWDRNRITIWSSFSVVSDELVTYEDQCKHYLDKIRLSLHVEDGKSFFSPHSLASSLFSQRGYRGTSDPENWQGRLDQIIEINVRLVPLNLKSDSILCFGQLLSTDVFMKK